MTDIHSIKMSREVVRKWEEHSRTWFECKGSFDFTVWEGTLPDKMFLKLKAPNLNHIEGVLRGVELIDDTKGDKEKKWISSKRLCNYVRDYNTKKPYDLMKDLENGNYEFVIPLHNMELEYVFKNNRYYHKHEGYVGKNIEAKLYPSYRDASVMARYPAEESPSGIGELISLGLSIFIRSR